MKVRIIGAVMVGKVAVIEYAQTSRVTIIPDEEDEIVKTSMPIKPYPVTQQAFVSPKTGQEKRRERRKAERKKK